jgi:anti-anti-sigma factor
MNYRLLNRTSDAAVVVLDGDFDALGAGAVRSSFEELVTDGGTDVVVDMSGVRFMDSSGIGALVYLYKRLVAAGRGLELVGLDGQPLELVNLLRVDKAIPVNRRALLSPASTPAAGGMPA